MSNAAEVKDKVRRHVHLIKFHQNRIYIVYMTRPKCGEAAFIGRERGQDLKTKRRIMSTSVDPCHLVYPDKTRF